MKKPYQTAVDNIVETLEWFFTRAFSKIHVDLNGYKPETLKDSMVMAVSSHRSQTDYFLFGWVLFNNGVKYLRIAAGDNLTTLPFIGKKFKSFGAFPVKRDMALRKNYVRQLCLDVVGMLEDNEPILVFPEGGRSYGGDMMEPRGGILLSAILAQARNPQKKVYLLPGTVSYEYLPELPYFEMLGKGKEMRKKSNNVFRRLAGTLYYFGADILAFGKFLLRTRLGLSQGEVYVDIGTPLAVNEIVDVKANFNAKARDDFSGHQASMRIVCNKLSTVFRSLYRFLPEHVVAGVLKKNPAIAKRAAAERVQEIVLRLREQKRNTKTLDALTEHQIVAIGFKQLRRVKAVSMQGGALAIRKQSIIDYYASALME
ncbi:MAG TPA: 1-acyl-sn-glycerol-3-phosphate acyltransferase [Chitinivibrionales bacterium]|nr:1-acyl-sn-glycerol-3-phosphate acyltransferase [Chitinivibrionales bacterium]